MAPARIESIVAPVVNHAMAHNGIHALHRVTLSLPPEPATATLRDVQIGARLVDDQGHTLTQPWTHHLERLDAGEQVVLDDPPLQLDAAAMAGLDEATHGDLSVTVTAEGQPVAELHSPVRVLATRQWLIDPDAPLLSLELLAAFVQPNHPALGPLVGRAAALLERATSSGSLAVSHVSPGRLDAIVEAVCTAIHDEGIFYAEPPASWGYGQQVRTPGDVLGHKVGTCLDTTVLLASALEHLGIHPVVWIARGHAFLGYWRTDGAALPDAASLSVAEAVNAVGLGLMGLVETTMLTRERRPPRDLFRRASQAPRDTYVDRDQAALLGVVDIAMARLMRVYPVPAHTVRPDGRVEVVTYQPPTPLGMPVASTAAGSPSGATGFAPRATDSGTGADGIPPRAARVEPPPRVQAWKNSLLDLTLRNPLLNLGRGVTNLPLVLPGEHLGVLADMLAEGKPIALRAVDDLPGAMLGRELRSAHGLPADVLRSMLHERGTAYTAVDTDTHERLVARLRYRARTGAEETGANPLALALGRLDWRLGERDLSAPLVLAPIHLKGVIRPVKIVADDSGEVTLNLSLMEKLRLEFGLVVPGLDELPVKAEPAGAVDVNEVVRRVRQAVVDAGLPFTVTTEARLAIVGFTGYLLWRDLDEHWEQFLQQPVARHVALTPTERFTAVDATPVDVSTAALDEVTAGAPIPTDGSQAEAVAFARAGRTFVLEGPPGTGKSQTITTIIADQIAAGRRVLFVAEKGAALDVVRRRLDEVGLTPYVLDLHDEHARPAQVRERLRIALAQLPRPDEDGFRAATSELTATSATLGAYAGRLHSPGPLGLSAYGAHTQLLAHGPGPVLPIADGRAGEVRPEEVAAARAALVAATPAVAALTPELVSAWGFVRSAPEDHAALARLSGLVGAADAAVDDAMARLSGCPEIVREIVLGTTDPGGLEVTGWLLSEAATPVEVIDEMASARWQEGRSTLDTRTAALREAAAPLLTILSPEVLGIELEPVRQALREASASFFIGRKRRLIAAAAPVLQFARPGAPLPAKSLPGLVEQLAGLAHEARSLAQGWRSLPGLGGLSSGLNLVHPDGERELGERLGALDRDAALARTATSGTTGVSWRDARRRGAAPILDETYAALRASAQAIAAVIAAVAGPSPAQAGGGFDDGGPGGFGSGDGGARDEQVRAWATHDGGLLPAWTAGATDRRADVAQGAGLRRWAAAAAALAALDRPFAPARWRLLTGEVPAELALAAWDRGVAQASLQARVDEGGLRGFDAGAHDRVVERFVASSAAVRETLHGILPARVVTQRPFSPGALFGRVAALEREVTRTRGGLSVRRLVQTYGEIIGEVTPCLLVSPDSLARFVPPGAIGIDLVVFDEASQITVPDAIGALGRARAAVIAGDSKQLPPTSFGQASEAEVDEELGRAVETPQGPGSPGSPATPATPDETGDAALGAEDFLLVRDEESILSEMVHAGVDRLWLTWHYRSQDESLIAFSNRAYYEDRLNSFPSAPGADADRGVSFTRVDGTFLRSPGPGGPLRTNPVEAAAVVAEVRRRWSAGERSIGVVTFNAQQRTLIERMLWESGDEALLASLSTGGSGLFVKNLENVQGDERDVVIFSTGFSAAKNGIVPLNFGPLNRAGGERRLNVAITRARRRVMVFCSFEPEDLRVEATSSVGVHHLRAYLELAKYGASRASEMTDAATGGEPADAGREVARDAFGGVAAGRNASGGGARGSGGVGRVREVRVDRHRDEVAAALRAAGLEVTTAVGMSDFKVDLAVGSGDGRPACLAVLLDSPEWSARRTTNDREALPTTVLHDLMGWPAVMRIWLPTWLFHRDEVIEQVRAQVEVALSAPRRRAGRVTTTGYAVGSPEAGTAAAPQGGADTTRPQDEDRPAPQDDDRAAWQEAGATQRQDEDRAAPQDSAATPQDGGPTLQDGGIPSLRGGDPTVPQPDGVARYQPFVPRIVGTIGLLDRLGRDARATAQVMQLLHSIIETEGPVAPRRAAELVARSVGLSRPPAYRLAEIERHVPPEVVRDEEGFLWPQGWHPQTWTGFRTWEATLRQRPLEDIALRELANAHAAVARSAMGITEEELLRQTLRLFNGTRLTDAPRARLTAALRLAAQRGQVDVSAGIVMPRDHPR